MEDKVIINGVEYPNLHDDLYETSLHYDWKTIDKKENTFFEFSFILGIILFIVFLVLLILYFKKKK